MKVKIIIDDYIKMIKAFSSSYAVKMNCSVYTYEELIREGTLIFYECLEKFNPDKAKFVTYLFSALRNNFQSLYVDRLKRMGKIKNKIVLSRITYKDYKEIPEEIFEDIMIRPFNENPFEAYLLKTTIMNLSNSAKSTFSTMLKYNGIEGGKLTRNRRMKNLRPNLNLNPKEFKKVMEIDRTLKNVKLDFIEIKNALKK